MHVPGGRPRTPFGSRNRSGVDFEGDLYGVASTMPKASASLEREMRERIVNDMEVGQ
jgi:hypothetical protein